MSNIGLVRRSAGAFGFVLIDAFLEKCGSAQESDNLPKRPAFSEKDLWLA